jgi:NAD-dependent dihydropyrimidine dehydrogenase PreA subunit
MIVGVVLHTALHWKWVTMMVRRLAGGGRATARPTTAAAPATPAAISAAIVAPDAFAESGRSIREPDSARRDPESASRERDAAARQTLTRHAFLKGAGAVGAAALVGGLVGRAAAGAAVTWLGDDASTTRAGSTTASLEQDSAGGWGSGSSETQDSQSSSGDAGATQTTPTARVTIDAGRCNGCGACLQVCPFGVFSTDGSRAVVVDESACRLCGHCTQVCRPAAITLNG